MQTDTAPYILRSICCDDHIAATRLANPATELMTSVLGAQLTNKYDAHIIPCARGLYTFFSMLKGQTPGEEFCDTLAVTGGRPWRQIGTMRKVLLGLLQMFEPTGLFYAARFFFPSVAPDDVMANVNRVVLALLFLFERFGTLPHRVLRIRYLSLKPARALREGEGAPNSYLVLGLVVVVELVVRYWKYSKNRTAAAVQQHEDTVKGENTWSDDEDHVAVSGRCMLCLGPRKSPTATLCGHIFCWRCIAEWIQAGTRDSVCPFCRQHITAQTLVPLYFYVAKELPRVGSAQD